jgi:hypothetical protein
MLSYYKAALAVNLGRITPLLRAFGRLSLDARLEVGIPSGQSIIVAHGGDHEDWIQDSVVAILVISYSVIPTRAQDLDPGFTKVKDGIRLQVSEAESI